MPGFKLYEVKGVKEPLRLSDEHAKEIGAKEVGPEQLSVVDSTVAANEEAAAKSSSKSTSKS